MTVRRILIAVVDPPQDSPLQSQVDVADDGDDDDRRGGKILSAFSADWISVLWSRPKFQDQDQDHQKTVSVKNNTAEIVINM